MHTSLDRLPDFIARSAIEAPWLAVALREYNVRESPGLQQNNLRILEYISSFPYLQTVNHFVNDPKSHRIVKSGYMAADVDETAWCACFVAWCLRRAGQPTTGTTARAKDWLQFGTALPAPRLGAVAVMHRRPTNSTANTTRSGFHVAFYLTGPALAPTLFGGNQGNKAKSFHGWNVLGYRWPWNFQSPLPPNVG